MKFLGDDGMGFGGLLWENWEISHGRQSRNGPPGALSPSVHDFV